MLLLDNAGDRAITTAATGNRAVPRRAMKTAMVAQNEERAGVNEVATVEFEIGFEHCGIGLIPAAFKECGVAQVRHQSMAQVVGSDFSGQINATLGFVHSSSSCSAIASA
jgi:hypothetical protein